MLDLSGDVLKLIADYLLPEDMLMFRQVHEYIQRSIPTDFIKRHDEIVVGSFVCYKYRYTRSDFPIWGSRVGYVTHVEGNSVIIDKSIKRARSGVKRIRIFPDAIVIAAYGGIVKECPGCYGTHHTHGIDCYKFGECLISANEAKIFPFPKGYYLMTVWKLNDRVIG